MTYIPDQQQNTGSYISTTQVWDVGSIYSLDVRSPEFKELIVRLYQQINNVSLALNTKDSGFYLNEEFNTGINVFNPTSTNMLDLRPLFRKVINIGALPAGATVVAHGIPIIAGYQFVKINGAASRTTAPLVFHPIPSATISVIVDATNVTITNGSGVAFQQAVVVLEYVKF